MTFPTPAQRADWFRSNHETSRYGHGHRPSPTLVGAAWRAGCACGCDRGEDGWDYPTFEDALDAAKTNLAAAEHGPNA